MLYRFPAFFLLSCFANCLLASEFDLGLMMKSSKLETAAYSTLAKGLSLGYSHRFFESLPLSLGVRATAIYDYNLQEQYASLEAQYWWRHDNDQKFFPFLRVAAVVYGEFHYKNSVQETKNPLTGETEQQNVRLSGRATGFQASFGWNRVYDDTTQYLELGAMIQLFQPNRYSIDGVIISPKNAGRETNPAFTATYGIETR